MSAIPHYITRVYESPPVNLEVETPSIQIERDREVEVPGTYRETEVEGVRTFSSYVELLEYLNKLLKLRQIAGETTALREAVMPAVTLGTPTKTARDTRFSKTNIQVEGVDEPDIVKTDGDIIAVAVDSTIYIVDTRSKRVVSSFTADSSIAGLFLLDKKIVALSHGAKFYSLALEPSSRTKPISFQKSSTTVWVVDVSNAGKPELKLKISVTGSLLTARTIGSYVYVLVTQSIEALELPAIDNTPLPPSSIGLVDDEPNSYTTVVAVSLSDYEYTAYSFLTGSGSWVYMSLGRLYVGGSKYLTTNTTYRLFLEALLKYLPKEVADNISKLLTSSSVSEAFEVARRYLDSVSDREFDEITSRVNEELKKIVFRDETRFYVFSISGLNISFSGSFSVSGMVLDQFSMEEMGSYFTVATTITSSSLRVYTYRAVYVSSIKPITIVERQDNGTVITKTYTPATKASTTKTRFFTVNPEVIGESENSVSVISLKDLKEVGSLRGLAKGERIYSARLIKNILFLVTFRVVDPLFAIDLSNPEKPEVLGYLKIPGFSEYLHPLYEDRLLGVGLEEGSLKLSLFDVSDPAKMSEISKILVECSWTPVLSDHRAISIDRDFEFIYLPISSYCSYPYVSGISIVSYDRDSISFKKLLEVDGAQRALYVGEELYVVSQDKLVIYSLPELKYVIEIPLR